MGLTVNGNVYVKGDQLFDNSMKIVKGSAEAARKESLTMELMRQKIDAVLPMISNGRMWFPVCKYMMEEGLCPEGDFKDAAEKIKELLPDAIVNATDLSRLDVLSFRKKIVEWDENDSPIKDRTTFHRYKHIGEALFEV